MKMLNWAVVGTGYIANRFAQGMQLVDGVHKTAICSRDDQSAKSFADQYGFTSSYADYEAMLQQETLDIVYLAIPNNCHFVYASKALDAGVSVLCEKPLADNMAQFNELTRKAQAKGLFLMEGMWTRCFPAVRQAIEWMDQGEIGEVLTVHAHLDYQTDASTWQTWKASRQSAGSALRDVGIYALAMAYLALKDDPQKVVSNWRSNGEVDISADLMLIYDRGRTAFLSGAFNRDSEHEAYIIGDRGRIEIGPNFGRPNYARLFSKDQPVKEFDDPFQSTGFQYEIMHVNECLQKGLQESPYFTLDESARIGGLMETLRKEWGIVYDADK